MSIPSKIRYYASLFFAIFIVIIDICYLFLFANPNVWNGFETYIENYRFIEVLPTIVGFVFLPCFLIAICGIVLNNNIGNTITGKLSISFATAFVFLVSIGYFIQFGVVYPNIHAENSQIYELWMFGNTSQSIAWGLNYLGWFWGGVCTFLLAFKIKDRLVKVLFIVYGLLLGIAFIGYCIRFEPLQTVLGLAWFIVLPLAFFRVALLFRRILKGLAEWV